MYLYVLGPLDLKRHDELQPPVAGGEYQEWGEITVNGQTFTQMVWNPTPGTPLVEMDFYGG